MSKQTIASLSTQVAALQELIAQQAAMFAQLTQNASQAPTQSKLFPAKPVAFTTKRNAADKMSKPVVILNVLAAEATKEILVFCSDGKTRRCRTERLVAETPEALWERLQEAGKAETEVKFVAAGGFSPDTWFYDFQA